MTPASLQPRVVELLADRETATRVAGLFVVTLALASRSGAIAASAIPERFVTRPNRGAAAFVAIGFLGFVVLATAPNVWWFAVGLAVVYVSLAAWGVFVDEQLHDAIEERQRVTMLSVKSTALQLAGAGTGLVITRLADETSIPVAMAAAGVVTVLGIPVLLSVPDATDNQESKFLDAAMADCPT
jgi:MFS family permease